MLQTVIILKGTDDLFCIDSMLSLQLHKYISQETQLGAS